MELTGINMGDKLGACRSRRRCQVANSFLGHGMVGSGCGSALADLAGDCKAIVIAPARLQWRSFRDVVDARLVLAQGRRNSSLRPEVCSVWQPGRNCRKRAGSTATHVASVRGPAPQLQDKLS